VIALVAFAPAKESKAETLNEALAAAYATSPELEAQRAATRATDEAIPQARAALYPQIFGNANFGYKNERYGIDGPTFNSQLPGLNFPVNGEINTSTAPRGYSITLQQQIFRGLQTLHTIREAEANALASREDLRNTEQTTLLNAVTAYMGVVQSEAVVSLRYNNVKVLTDELASNQRRFKAGALTNTDLSQSKAQRATSVASLEAAKGQVRSNRATFEEVIGHEPRSLRMPRSIGRVLPTSLKAALEIARFENPSIGSAFFRELAAGKSVDALRGQLLPEVSVQLKFNDQYDTFEGIDSERAASAVVGIKVPIFQGGYVGSQVRQAKQLQLQRLSQMQQAQAQVRSAVISAWSQLDSARAQLAADEASVHANKVALAGVRREEGEGKRTVLDVLNAEQTYLASQIQRVTDESNVVVAEHALLQAIGRLTASNLVLPVAIYRTDITDHSERALLWRTEIKPEKSYFSGESSER